MGNDTKDTPARQPGRVPLTMATRARVGTASFESELTISTRGILATSVLLLSVAAIVLAATGAPRSGLLSRFRRWPR